MTDHQNFDDGKGPSPVDDPEKDARSSLSSQFQLSDIHLSYERIIPRVLRNMMLLSVALLAPTFWFYRLAGTLGFAFGAAISYVNFRSLTQGVEGLADRIVNRNSREKGARIVLRFLIRYGLVGAVAYAIFKSSSQAFRGFLWGLCVPIAALMVEAIFEGCVAFRMR